MQIVRESIFLSAVRSFCNALFGLVGIVVGLLLLGVFLFALFGSHLTPAQKSEYMITPDAEGSTELLPMSAPVILHLDIHGIIGLNYLTGSVVEGLLLDSRDGLLKGNRVKAILLHMNTPGGTATDSDEIYRHLAYYKKKYDVPIYAYVEGLCASGGMLITSAADKIYASPSSVVGSIGVVLGPNFNFSGLMDKYGVSQVTLTEGKDKDMLNPFRPWKEGEAQSLVNINTYFYERFISIVTAARTRLDKDKLMNEYGAQVYSAPEGAELGYIDEGNSDYQTVLMDLAAAAHISGQKYQVIKIQPPHNILNDLMQAKLPFKITHRLEFDSLTTSERKGVLPLLYQP
jgi:signal peptide peptidase SppA